jgi:hypothetical protein
MKKTGLSATLTIALGCAVVTAQSGSTGAAPQSQSRTESRQSDKQRAGQVTMIGCLQPSDSRSATTGTSGAASAASGTAASGTRAASGNSYVLTNATLKSGATSHGAGAGSGSSVSSGAGSTGAGSSGDRASDGRSGTSATGTPSRSESGSGSAGSMTYALQGGTNLKQHVGHQVEVTGTLASAGQTGSSTSGSSTSIGSTSAQSGSAVHEAGGTLRVSSVRMVAPTCER